MCFRAERNRCPVLYSTKIISQLGMLRLHGKNFSRTFQSLPESSRSFWIISLKLGPKRKWENKLGLSSAKLRKFWLRYEIVVVLQTGSQIFSHKEVIYRPFEPTNPKSEVWEIMKYWAENKALKIPPLHATLQYCSSFTFILASSFLLQ